MKQNHSKLQVCCFILFLLLFAVLLLVLPDRDFSENENRYLAQRPRFTLPSFFSGQYVRDFETYITDQFPLRDSWISLKSRTERAVGKTENNQVFFCAEDSLITRFAEPEPRQVETAVAAVNTLAREAEVPVYLALIPSAAAIWQERLPALADTADQKALIQQILETCSASSVNIYDALAAHAQEDIYYRTDHHWTGLGAYYGYRVTAEAMGLSPLELDAFSPETVSNSFYGTVYSSSGVRWVQPDSIQRYVPDTGITVTKYEGDEAFPASVYAPEKLQTKDQYAFFFGGNTPRMVIETGCSGGKLLVLRDSYADSELPFFFSHFSEIHTLDLRYYRQSILQYIRDAEIDSVLISYSLSNFVTDSSVYLLGT